MPFQLPLIETAPDGDMDVLSKLAGALALATIIAAILPPGYPAYIGAYAAIVLCALALLVFGVPEREGFRQPTSLATIAAIALVALTVPFTYRGDQDLLAPVFVLPMLCVPALGLLARPARWVPGFTLFAVICLVAAVVAFSGGVYERYVLGIYRPGMGNNPIHFASLAVMAGSLAMVGVAASAAPWRYIFLLGPILGLACAIIADSRGPMVGGAAMVAVGLSTLLIWYWREGLFRLAFLAAAAVGAGAAAYLVATGNTRVAGIIDNALNIFRFTGGSDDIRAALYHSALHALAQSPLYGIGLGQIMHPAQELFPQQGQVFSLDNLHADWANFATMSGGMGLLAYLLLIAAPLLLLLHRPARQQRPIVLGALLLSSGQLILGISNAMFGILPQTVIYAVALGYLLLQARRLDLEHPLH